MSIFSKLKERINTREYTVSKDTAQALAKALTTLDPGDKLTIELLGERVVIFCSSLTIGRKKK